MVGIGEGVGRPGVGVADSKGIASVPVGVIWGKDLIPQAVKTSEIPAIKIGFRLI
jgi:hypothetical protein